MHLFFFLTFLCFYSFLTLYSKHGLSTIEKLFLLVSINIFSLFLGLCMIVVAHCKNLSTKCLVALIIFLVNLEPSTSFLSIYIIECFFIAVFSLLFIDSKIGQKIWNLYLFSIFNFIILHITLLNQNFAVQFIFLCVVLTKLYSPLTFCVYTCAYEQISFFTLVFFCCLYPLCLFCLLLQVKLTTHWNSFVLFFLFLHIFFTYMFIHNTKKMFLVIIFSSCANLSTFILLMLVYNSQKTFVVFFCIYGLNALLLLSSGKTATDWKIKKVSWTFDFNSQNKNIIIFFGFSSFAALPLSWNFFFKIFCLVQIYLCTNFSVISIFLFLFFLTTLLYFYMLISLQMNFQKKFLLQKTNFFCHWAVLSIIVLVGIDVIGFFVFTD